jgi:hypothetical protein
MTLTDRVVRYNFSELKSRSKKHMDLENKKGKRIQWDLNDPALQRVVAPKKKAWVHPKLIKAAKNEEKALKQLKATADAERKFDEYVEQVREMYPPIDEVTMTITEKGRTFEEIAISEIFKPEDVHCKIIAWKFDHEWEAFMIKRQSGIVDYFTTSYLLVQGTSKLDKFDMSQSNVINHGHVALALLFSRVLHRWISGEVEGGLSPLALQADNEYVKLLKDRNRKWKKASKKKGKLEDKEFVDPSVYRKNFRPQVDDLKKRVVVGTQASCPITRVVYDSEFCELVLYRDNAEKSGSIIRLFSAFELSLLDPSYVNFIADYRWDTAFCHEYARRDKTLFMYLAKLSQTAHKNIALRKLMAEASEVPIVIEEVTRLHVTEKDQRQFLVVTSADGTSRNFYSKDELARLDMDTLMLMSRIRIECRHEKLRGVGKIWSGYIRDTILASHQPIPASFVQA